MYHDSKYINWVAVRIGLVAVLFALGTVLLMVRAYRLSVMEADNLKKRAAKQRNLVLHLEARRGMILDRSGDQMAASLEVNSVYARPRRIKDKEQTARVLSDILELDESSLLAKLREEKAFVWLQRRVSPLVTEKLAQSDLPGIFTDTEYQRFYPLKTLAAHTVGFAGIDSTGLEGLELYYDKDLKAAAIPVTAQRGARGRPIMFASTAHDSKRRDLHLTLDRNVQYIAERELEDGVRNERAKGGIAIVMDADSGELLAVAVSPVYNLNVFHKVPADTRRNKSVADVFEPGSTFKVFLAAAALELGRVDFYEKFNCHNGLYRYNGAEIHDLIPHKTLSFEEIIIHSSNIGAVKISEKLQKADFYKIVQSFGFGASTGVDLPGERSGYVPPPGRWSVLTKGNIAFGQGLTVSSIQLTAGFAAAVNGGFLHRPHLMRRIVDAMGDTVRDNQSLPVRTVIKPTTSESIVNILRQAVSQGTGKAAAIKGHDVIGKTGTSQKVGPAGGYSPDKCVASFIGAVMDVKPRLVIFVMIDEPESKNRTGGKVAAPVFRKIGECIIALCGGKPKEPDIVQASLPVRYVKPGQTPHRSVLVRKGSRPGSWVVPDMKGFEMRQVLDVCGKMKCDLSFKGTGLVTEQEPKPGTILNEGAILTVCLEGQYL
jgi:cell division protein FtsI (penicillin-binding protein 3)